MWENICMFCNLALSRLCVWHSQHLVWCYLLYKSFFSLHLTEKWFCVFPLAWDRPAQSISATKLYIHYAPTDPLSLANYFRGQIHTIRYMDFICICWGLRSCIQFCDANTNTIISSPIYTIFLESAECAHYILIPFMRGFHLCHSGDVQGIDCSS